MSTRPVYAHVYQINISDGGVPKLPVLEAKVSEQGLDGDRQRNLKLHGGPDRACGLFSCACDTGMVVFLTDIFRNMLDQFS